MRPSTILYELRQGFRNIRRNWMFSVASVLTMTACIFLFGIFYSIVLNLTNIGEGMENKIPVTVYFDEGTTDEEIELIGSQIRERPDVESITYVSADEAWKQMEQEYFHGDEEAAKGFKDINPLADSSNYRVTSKTIETQDDLVKYIMSLDHVRQVNQARKAAKTVGDMNSVVYYASMIIIGILLLISIFLISNTVSVGISVRKEEIGIMKYIGATDRFVRAPFVLEGIILGAVGAAIPLTALYFIYNETVNTILSHYSAISDSVEFMTVDQVFRTLAPVGILLGIGIGLVGSFLTTRKHVRV